MTLDEHLDAALDSVLKAAGSAQLRHYMPTTQAAMRDAMSKIIADAWRDGMADAKKLRKKEPKA